MLQILIILGNVVIRSALLSLVLFGGWNYGVMKFFTQAPFVQLLDCIIILGAVQTLAIFLLRPSRKELVPVYIPTDALNTEVKELE